MPDGPGGFAQNYSCSALLRIPLGLVSLRIRNCHPLRLNFPGHSAHKTSATARSYNPGCASPHRRFGLFPVRSPLLGESFSYFLFLQVLRCFSSLRSPHHSNVVITVLQTAGLSHSEIAGSRVICTYPALIAAYHVLHRLREPRHPPDALTCFRRLLRPPQSESDGGEVLLILSAVINC